MEFDSYEHLGDMPEHRIYAEYIARKFTCGFCDTTWHSVGYKSNCWMCGREHVILTLNDPTEIE